MSELQDLLERFRRGPELIAVATTGASGAQLSFQPAPGKWSVRQIVCHLSDMELGAAVRFRKILAEENPSLDTYDPDAWAERLHYEQRKFSQALDSLREILKLYEFADTPVTRQRIEGLVGLRSKKVLRRVREGGATGFARGIEVELEFDEEKYTGGGVFLFASVLERFLGLYTSLNSFTQTVARVRQRGGVFKRWPPRAGEIQVL